MPSKLFLLLSLLLFFFVSLAQPQDLSGAYYDYTQDITVHVCNGPGLDVNFGISTSLNPYFISIFGRGVYNPSQVLISNITNATTTVYNQVNGSEAYFLNNNNGGYSKGYFTFTRVNSTRWTAVGVPTLGGLTGTTYNLILDQFSTYQPEEEFCIRAATVNDTIFGQWEWLETKNGIFHHTKSSFYGYNATAEGETNSTFPLSLTQGAVTGCWGYTDRSINREFQGNYSGTVIFEGRGWIGAQQQVGNSQTSSVFFMRVGFSSVEERIVGYSLLPGRDNPAGFQVISNSATIGNVNLCPVIPNAGCSSSESFSTASSLSGVLLDIISIL